MEKNRSFGTRYDEALASFPNGVHTPGNTDYGITRVMDGNVNGHFHNQHNPSLPQEMDEGLPYSADYGPYCDPPYTNVV